MQAGTFASTLPELERHQPLPLPPRLCGVGLAVPATSFSQPEMLELLGLAGDPFAEGIFARCGVSKRHLEISPEVLDTRLQGRTPETEEQLLRLAVEAIDQLGIEPGEVGVLVTASYYSLGGPTLAHRIVDRYELDPSVDKYHLTGIGCASAVPLFRLAGQALRDRPGQKALVVAGERVSGFLTRALPGDGKTKVVGSALFGDGSAAALLAADPQAPGPAIVATAVHQVPGTLGHVHFSVTEADTHMQLSRELPAIAEESLEGLVEDFLAPHGLGRAAIDHWLVHPGGRGILEGVQAGLGLSDEQVETSTRVLSEFGNVGTPASVFVLGRTLTERSPSAGELGLMVTIGPGVTVGLMLLAW